MVLNELVDLEEEVVVVTPILVKTPSGHTYFVASMDTKEEAVVCPPTSAKT